jgi:hypothetical protein
MAKPATRNETIAVGAVAAAAGIYFMLVGTGVVPVPGGPRNLHAPLWVVFCAGLAFFLGGFSVLVQVYARGDADGRLPADAPIWLPVLLYLIGVAIFASFALIATWIAFGDGPRQFSASFGGSKSGVGTGIGRIVFGISAVVMWMCTIGFAKSGLRKLRGRPAAANTPT